MANRTALARFVQGGVIPVTTNAVLSEVHRTWNRPEAAKIGELYAHVSPNYAAVVESYVKAQEVCRAGGCLCKYPRHAAACRHAKWATRSAASSIGAVVKRHETRIAS
jgi:hypothetical protein